METAWRHELPLVSRLEVVTLASGDGDHSPQGADSSGGAPSGIVECSMCSTRSRLWAQVQI